MLNRNRAIAATLAAAMVFASFTTGCKPKKKNNDRLIKKCTSEVDDYMMYLTRGKFEKHRKDGYFMYGNHTQDIADPFIPNMINLPKTNYVVVHANNVSMPVLGKITPSLGALPIPEGMKGYKNFLEAIDTRISQGHCVVIYPEAHIWPYYTKIRNFPDTSFAYPAKSGTPVYCFTNTYHKRRFFKHPRIITYVDGPFYPDMDQPLKARRKELRDKVYQAMCRRAKNSDHEQIKYIRKTDGGTETND